MKSPAVTLLVEELVAQLEAICATRTREIVASSLGQLGPPPRAPGVVLPFARPRKKAAAQLCPAPACLNRAAPAYSMLCASHKDTPPATVRAWRAARRARKGR
jgi:hypothetical protein